MTTWKGVDLTLGSNVAATAASSEATKKTSFVALLGAAVLGLAAVSHSFEWICNETDQLCAGPGGYMQRDPQTYLELAAAQACPVDSYSLKFWLQRDGFCDGGLHWHRPKEATICLVAIWLGIVLSLICGLAGLCLPHNYHKAILGGVLLSTVSFSVSVHTFLDWPLVDRFLSPHQGGFVFLSSNGELFVSQKHTTVMSCTQYFVLLVGALSATFFSSIALLVVS
ncbi:hypothetical protein BASA81_003311 [Batrachochytrium salamandrivorans]|nr:hypothetical protein BASA81_003311 [Batrachochytrium salamandrivorans]